MARCSQNIHPALNSLLSARDPNDLEELARVSSDTTLPLIFSVFHCALSHFRIVYALYVCMYVLVSVCIFMWLR